MIIGVPKEIKNHEYRVGLIPGSVAELTRNGHQVIVETAAGQGSAFTDADYTAVGATISTSAKEVFDTAEMIVKVKEPQASERQMLRQEQLLFTYLHLAPDHEQTEDLINSGAVCIAYETVTGPQGSLPLLAPMSEVAGRLSVQAGAHYLEKMNGGRGVLLGGVPGAPRAKVVIIGGGIVGVNAAVIALGMGAEVIVLDNNLKVLRQLDARFGGHVQTEFSNSANLEMQVADADLVVGGVLIPGAVAPKLITKEMIEKMRPGAVVVDVAIDQGGCFDTSAPTTHAEPTYVIDDVVHYCVTNMPGLVPRTSSIALNNATLPYALQLANKGYVKALCESVDFAAGLNVYKGEVTYKAVADSQNLPYKPPTEVLN